MKQAISKPVIVVIVAGIALTAFLVRRGSGQREKAIVAESAAAIVQAQPETTPEPSAESAPAAGAAQETDLACVVPLPLSAVVIEAENGMWLTNSDYLSVPRGTQSFGGVEFHLEGMLQMQGTGSESAGRKYRKRIALPLAQAGVTNARISSVHLLGGTRFQSEPGEEVAEIVWRFADGQSQQSRLVYDEHIRDWNRAPYEQPARLPYAYSRVVWRAEKPTPAGRQLRLYRVTLENPEPQKAVRQIELSSGRGAASLFLVAATLDPLAAGTRPDDSPDLEPTDPVPPQNLEVWVETEEGRPLPNAKVRVQWRLKNDKGAPTTKQLAADPSGMTRATFPAANLSRLDITASHDDFASRKMAWDIVAGDVIPSSYQIKLVAGVNIGGLIVDSSDSPISGAKLSFHRFWSGEDAINRKGDQPEFNSRTTTADAQGAWQMKNLPRDMLGNIMFNVEHPDYLSTNLTVGANAQVEKQLRASTLKLILHRGLEVRGLVTDENGSPISGATVWVGRQFFRDRQSTNSDESGRFVFPNISEGDIVFSAMAKGRRPESKTFKVSPGMSDVVLKLGPGSVIKGIVQTRGGEPLSDVRVSLESNGLSDYGYEFSTSTGADGRFVWDSAPDDPMRFYFGKPGYAQLRGQTLKPNFDKIITLRNPRQIQGQVLDAASGQPVTKFRVASGRSMGPDQFFSNYPDTKQFADANGQFTLALDEAEQNALRVGADDYSDQTQTVPSGQDEVIKMEFRLKASPALKGVVVGPDGTPLPGVQVAIVKEAMNGPSSISLRRGKLEKRGSETPLAITDASGGFSIDSPPESGGKVIALGDLGFGSATVEQVRANGVLALLPFGRLEGAFKIAGEPASGRELLFSLQKFGISTDFEGFKVETDDQGKFKFEKLPAGEGEIVRLIKTSPNSWMHSHNTSVTIEPGQTTIVNLGDAGAVLKGHVRLESPPADGEPLNINGNLSSSIERPNLSADEARAFYQSSEWQARVKLLKHFGVAVNADGSFLLDSVPAGSYSLILNAFPPGTGAFGPMPGKLAASRTLNVTVPDSATPQVPIDLGEIILSPPAKRQP